VSNVCGGVFLASYGCWLVDLGVHPYYNNEMLRNNQFKLLLDFDRKCSVQQVLSVIEEPRWLE